MSATASPSDLTDHLGYWLRMVSNAVSHGFARRVEAEGVTVAEWVFLRALFDSEGMAPTVLADRMGMTRGAISKLADRVEAKGLILRQGAAGRGQILSLTTAARALVPRLAALADANDAAFLAPLSAADRLALAGILQSLAAAHGLTAAPLD
ncbi:MarR family winged helix-turn-helix transcriptional regulator [Szabonella alba]|uniref:MarR family transcriptional regulator n=1 Tax=Szabonella alba TaxID=2804194 RepID=A0A8K0Y297_9RHOB|nr:MarR family transcriptional regulator [Szabonella alba]MBL4918977.1 MarR family transcriptional regulator [Szabonella alba]